jgi:hypothetical protein
VSIMASVTINGVCAGRTIVFLWYRWGVRASADPTGCRGVLERGVGESALEFEGRAAAVVAGL